MILINLNKKSVHFFWNKLFIWINRICLKLKNIFCLVFRRRLLQCRVRGRGIFWMRWWIGGHEWWTGEAEVCKTSRQTDQAPDTQTHWERWAFVPADYTGPRAQNWGPARGRCSSDDRARHGQIRVWNASQTHERLIVIGHGIVQGTSKQLYTVVMRSTNFTNRSFIFFLSHSLLLSIQKYSTKLVSHLKYRILFKQNIC